MGSPRGSHRRANSDGFSPKTSAFAGNTFGFFPAGLMVITFPAGAMIIPWPFRCATAVKAAYFPGSFSVPRRWVSSSLGVISGLAATVTGGLTRLVPAPPMDSACPMIRRVFPAGIISRMTSRPSSHRMASPGTIFTLPSGPNLMIEGLNTPSGLGVTSEMATPFSVKTTDVMATMP